jgi:hypothetical protein
MKTASENSDDVVSERTIGGGAFSVLCFLFMSGWLVYAAPAPVRVLAGLLAFIPLFLIFAYHLAIEQPWVLIAAPTTALVLALVWLLGVVIDNFSFDGSLRGLVTGGMLLFIGLTVSAIILVVISVSLCCCYRKGGAEGGGRSGSLSAERENRIHATLRPPPRPRLFDDDGFLHPGATAPTY